MCLNYNLPSLMHCDRIDEKSNRLINTSISLSNAKIYTQNYLGDNDNASINIYGFTSKQSHSCFDDIIQVENLNIEFYVEAKQFYEHFLISLERLKDNNSKTAYSRFLAAIYCLNLIVRFREFAQSHLQSKAEIELENVEVFALVFRMFCNSEKINASFNDKPIFNSLHDLNIIEAIEKEYIGNLRHVKVVINGCVLNVTNFNYSINQDGRNMVRFNAMSQT